MQEVTIMPICVNCFESRDQMMHCPVCHDYFFCNIKCYLEALPKHEEVCCKECEHCKVMSKTKLKRCSICQCTFYCNLACQQADWHNHKHQCSATNTTSKPITLKK